MIIVTSHNLHFLKYFNSTGTLPSSDLHSGGVPPGRATTLLENRRSSDVFQLDQRMDLIHCFG